MGLKVNVSTERFTGLPLLIRRLETPALRQAAALGLNEHIRLQERQAVRLMSGSTRIPAGRVASVTRSVKAGGAGAVLEAAVEVQDKAIPLGQHTSRSWSRSAPGATAGDWRQHTYPGTFTVRKYGGAIYQRVPGQFVPGSKTRQVIRKIWGPVLPNELRRPNQPTLPAARRLANSDLERRVLRHVVRVLGG